MTLAEAATKGILRVRQNHWANPSAYLKIDVFDGLLGPWGHLYDRPTQEAIGAATPQTFPLFGESSSEWVEWSGPTDE